LSCNEKECRFLADKQNLTIANPNLHRVDKHLNDRISGRYQSFFWRERVMNGIFGVEQLA